MGRTRDSQAHAQLDRALSAAQLKMGLGLPASPTGAAGRGGPERPPKLWLSVPVFLVALLPPTGCCDLKLL